MQQHFLVQSGFMAFVLISQDMAGFGQHGLLKAKSDIAVPLTVSFVLKRAVISDALTVSQPFEVCVGLNSFLALAMGESPSELKDAHTLISDI